MSQSETIMLILLGAVLTLIVVLLLGRMAWNMALKMGAKRKQRELPVAMLELQADRDRLRAEQAMMSRKLELRLEDVKMRMAEQMAEVSRNRNRVDIMTSEVAKRDETITQNQTEIDRMKTVLSNQDDELQSRAEIIERLSATINAKDVEISTLSKDMNILSATLREKTALVSNMNTELENTVRLAPSILPSNASTEDRIRLRISEMTVLSNQMTAEAENAPHQIIARSPALDERVMATKSLEDNLEEKLAEAERQTQELDAELKRLDDVWSEKITPIKTETSPVPEVEDQDKYQDVRRGGLNVVSLAQRIRALQRGTGE